MPKKFAYHTFAAILSATVALTSSTAIAQADCPANPEKSGTFTFSGATVAFIVGYRWGEGILKLENGQEFPFTARGLKLGETGVRDGEIIGDVYGLATLDDFIGHYKGEAGAVIPGTADGDVVLVNSECVTLTARYKADGLALSLPINQKISIQFAGD